MADGSWGHGRPAETDTGLMQVLAAFVTQGGHLLGARRSPDNPLTLTHIRWQGTGGTTVEAVRQDSSAESSAERDIWVQLALHFPAAQPAPAGSEPPWLPLSIDREHASPWVSMLRQDRAASRPYMTVPPYNGGAVSGTYPVAGDSSYSRQHASGYGSGSMPSRSTFVPMPPANDAPMPTSRQSAAPPFSAPYSMPSRATGEPSQWTGAWDRASMEMPEVVVLPCVEVELPPQIDGASADYRRDFSRDVAMHFGRAARGIPQVREVRGWMRGDRLVLAARFVVAMGNRPPARHEMDSAAQFLADVLAQRTLPYTQLGFADPGEWMQGAPLPE